MSVVFVTTSLEELKEKTSKGVTVTQFHATWCKDCIYVKPLYTKLVKENPSIKCIDVDIDKASNLKKMYNVQHIPTFILMKDGVELKRIVEPNYETLESFMAEAAKI